MNYCGYDFYYNDYYGSKIDGESFPRLAQKASDYLDYVTLGRAQHYSEEPRVKRCVCALAEVYQEIEQAEQLTSGGEIASESVGSHSVSYRSSAETLKSLKEKLASVVAMYLTGTPLRYRGVNVSCTHHIK